MPITSYERTTDFTAAQQAAPSDPISAPDLDQELDAVQASIENIILAIGDIRRDDGELANGIVTPESLAATLLTTLADLVLANMVSADLSFDNTGTKLTATDVQAALVQLSSKVHNLKSYGNPVTFTDSTGNTVYGTVSYDVANGRFEFTKPVFSSGDIAAFQTL